MTEIDQQKQQDEKLPEEKSRFATLAVQLVVIPLAVMLFCVGLGALFMWMTAERKTMDDYVGALRSSTGSQRAQEAQFLLNFIQESKRWQGIFDVSAEIGADSDRFLEKNPRAVAEIVQVFEESKGSDAKARRYLALVLGILGDNGALPSLREALNDSDAETVKNVVWALGRLGDEESAATIVQLTGHDEISVRLVAVHVLGSMDYPGVIDVLAASLNDPNELVQWAAAFALAGKGDVTGKDVLVRLLDKEYVDRHDEVTYENRQRYRISAVQWLAKLDADLAKPLLDDLRNRDTDLRVRNAAILQLNELRQYTK